MPLTPSDLDEAVRRGIVSAEQRDALLALAEERQEGTRAPVEARRGLNWVTVAYALGAGVVVTAFAWYLADRWRSLGPGGTLLVALLYGVLFGVAGWLLRREGFPTAGGIATLLCVAVAPVAMWAAMALLDLWPVGSPGWSAHHHHGRPWNASGWLAVDLSLLLAALVALRRVPFAPLTLAAALATASAVVHLSQALWVGAGMDAYMADRAPLVAAAVLLVAGYAADRRRGEGEPDHARWLYVVGLLALQWGAVETWEQAGAWKHALPLLALALAVAALELRRASFLVAAAVNTAWYLGYLAFDVFRDVVDFPIALATVGALVIVGTVLVQRRLPRLVRRLDQDVPGWRPSLTGGWITMGGAAAIALALYLAHIPEALDRRGEQEWRQDLAVLQQRNARRWGERYHRGRYPIALPGRASVSVPARPAPARPADTTATRADSAP